MTIDKELVDKTTLAPASESLRVALAKALADDAPIVYRVHVTGRVTVPNSENALIANTVVEGSWEERRRLPEWLHRRLLRLVAEPMDCIRMLPTDAEPAA
jgi:hypothetical protein